MWFDEKRKSDDVWRIRGHALRMLYELEKAMECKDCYLYTSMLDDVKRLAMAANGILDKIEDMRFIEHSQGFREARTEILRAMGESEGMDLEEMIAKAMRPGVSREEAEMAARNV